MSNHDAIDRWLEETEQIGGGPIDKHEAAERLEEARRAKKIAQDMEIVETWKRQQSGKLMTAKASCCSTPEKETTGSLEI